MRHVLVAAALLALPTLAHADLLNTFTVSGVSFNDSNVTETGTLTIDSTTDLATAISLNADGDILDTITHQGPQNLGWLLNLTGPTGDAILNLQTLDGFSLHNYTGGLFVQAGPNNLYTGDVTFLSSVNTAVPEPAPLALLAAGLLALPLTLRRLA